MSTHELSLSVSILTRHELSGSVSVLTRIMTSSSFWNDSRPISTLEIDSDTERSPRRSHSALNVSRCGRAVEASDATPNVTSEIERRSVFDALRRSVQEKSPGAWVSNTEHINASWVVIGTNGHAIAEPWYDPWGNPCSGEVKPLQSYRFRWLWDHHDTDRRSRRWDQKKCNRSGRQDGEERLFHFEMWGVLVTVGIVCDCADWSLKTTVGRLVGAGEGGEGWVRCAEKLVGTVS